MLRAFSAQTPELGVTEIAQIVGLNRSVVQKIVITLEREGFLRQLPESRRYQVGLGILGVAGVWLNANPLIREGTSVLRDLVLVSGMSGGLGVLDRDEAVYLVAIEAEASLKAASRVGDRRPLYATATGKCLLAFLSEPERAAQMARLRLLPFTPNTITDAQVFQRELEGIAETGYSLTHGERVLGLAGVAAPVWDHRERVVAAISIGVPEYLFVGEFLRRCITLTLEAARHLSGRLGSTRALPAGTSRPETDIPVHAGRPEPQAGAKP